MGCFLCFLFVAAAGEETNHQPDGHKDDGQYRQDEDDNPDQGRYDEFEGVDQRLGGVPGDALWLPSADGKRLDSLLGLDLDRYGRQAGGLVVVIDLPFQNFNFCCTCTNGL